MRISPFGSILAITLTLLGLSAATLPSYAEQTPPSRNIRTFVQGLVGEWVGSYQETTNGANDNNQKYFRTIVKSTGPNSYETTFEYYSSDPKTGAPLKVGCSTITTNIVGERLASNSITGYGQALVEPGTVKPQQHKLSEILQILPTGELQGTGKGTITINGLPMGAGKNGKVTDYHTTWELDNGVLKIKRQLRLKFKLLCFSKSCTIVSDFTARPGNDIASLIKSAANTPIPVDKAL